MNIVRNFTATKSRESLTARREVETLNGLLSTYVGHVDGIISRADENETD